MRTKSIEQICFLEKNGKYLTFGELENEKSSES